MILSITNRGSDATNQGVRSSDSVCVTADLTNLCCSDVRINIPIVTFSSHKVGLSPYLVGRKLSRCT